MSVFVVAYDLNKKGQDYHRIIKRIEQYKNSAKILESTWLISTTMTAAEIRDDLKKYTDSNDELAVLQVGGERPRWATNAVGDAATDFLKEHLR